MARRSSVGRWLLVAVVCLFMATILCCCSGVALVWYSPMMFLNWLVEDDPLAAPAPPAGDPEVVAEIVQRFEAGGPVRLTPDELLMATYADGSIDEVETLWLDVHDDELEVKVSVDMSGPDAPAQGYLNLHARGEVEIEHGWFTHVAVDVFTIGPLELGQYVVGQELASDANRSLADARSEDPKAAALLDELKHVVFEDGAIVVELEEGGFERLKSQ